MIDPASDPSRSRPDSWRRYLRFWGADVRRDVDTEIAFHIDELIAQFVASGMPRDEARRKALERFGDRERVARYMRALASQRETKMRRREWLNSSTRDIRFAIRQLARRPGFTIVALITLALGIGANAAIFSAVNTVLLRPLPVDRLNRVLFLHDNFPKLPLLETALDPTETVELGTRRDLFTALGGYNLNASVLSGTGDSRRLVSVKTLGSFFDVFSQAPYLGRFYQPDESERNQHRVVVLAYDLWRELGGNPTIVGQSIELDGNRYTVVGVMRAGFRYPGNAQIWIPFPLSPALKVYGGRLMMTTVGRLRDGVTNGQLQRALDDVTRGLHDKSNRGDVFMTTRRFIDEYAGELRTALLVLLGAVGCLLLIACANIASLQLVHGATRTRELAVRAALGAGRGAIIRQLLIENLVLSIGGGLLGLACGSAIVHFLKVSGAAELPSLQAMRLDSTVLAFTGAATLVSSLVFGGIPAMRAARVDLNASLREGARGSSIDVGKNRLLQAVVTGQIALTLVLLLGSGLMIRTLGTLLSQNPGFRAQHVSTAQVTIAGSRCAAAKEMFAACYSEVVSRLTTVPGLEYVGLVSELPFSGTNSSSTLRIVGRAVDPASAQLHANMHAVGGEYFKAMGIPLIKGRAFNQGDIAQPKQANAVVIVDQTFAKIYFPNEDPIGKQIDQGNSATIVGVVGSVSQGELGETPKATVYYPQTQRLWNATMYVVTRSSLPVASIAPTIRQVVASIDAGLAASDFRTLDSRVGSSLAPRRLAMNVLTGLALLSLGLAVCGLYGVISYATSQRTTEFGIRLALGAQSSDVRRMVIKQGALLAIVGVIIGLSIAFVATEAITKLLFGVSAHDPLTFLGAPFVVSLVAILASYLPARRATRVSPTDALRTS